jgi:prepilin-type N-terminal cleavage/methylation domain-containing protein
MLAMRKIHRGEQGFSLMESVIVIGIILIMLALAVAQSFGSMESYRANAAMDTIVAQLRVARQLAISQRRNVTLSFNIASSPQTITYQVVANPGDTVVPTPVTVPISTQVNFTGIAGEPDTPMAFGTCAGTYGVCIAGVSGGPPIMEFTSLGQFTDATLVNTLNGTIFMAIPSQIASARAVTIMGSTGRVRSYTYVGGSTTSTAWTE